MILESRPRINGPYGHADIPIETRLDFVTFETVLKFCRAQDKSRMEWLREAVDEKIAKSIIQTVPPVVSGLSGNYQLVRVHQVGRK